MQGKAFQGLCTPSARPTRPPPPHLQACTQRALLLGLPPRRPLLGGGGGGRGSQLGRGALLAALLRQQRGQRVVAPLPQHGLQLLGLRGLPGRGVPAGLQHGQGPAVAVAGGGGGGGARVMEMLRTG